ncbi:MAG: hypothetical protein NT045_00805 [Candidatus Aureabacteria bacterium]|nr:hypothetical protein [Candidatus Auribacterota bacterium]
MLNWYRDCLVWKRTGSADLLLSAARSEEIAGAAARIGEVEIEACIRRLEEASGALRMNADFLTVIESVLVQTSTKE